MNWNFVQLGFYKEHGKSRNTRTALLNPVNPQNSGKIIIHCYWATKFWNGLLCSKRQRYSLPFSSSLTPHQPHWSSVCPLIILSLFLPQSLCSPCPHHEELPFPPAFSTDGSFSSGLSWTECLCPPKSIVEVPTLKVIILGSRAFGKQLSLVEVTRVEPP